MVTFNGRITLPSHVRKQLGLKTGDSVDFVEIEKGRFAIISGSESIMALDQITAGREMSASTLDADSEENWAGMESSV
jgi:AbrB family looped-hinge helix DNA binding protein